MNRMGDGLGLRNTSPIRSLLSIFSLPRFDPNRYGVADYDFYAGAVDFPLAYAHGLKRPVIRVGQGYYGIDSQFAASSQNSKGIFVRDFYWMLDTKQSANGQANTCAQALIKDGNLDTESILFADFELAPVDASFLYGFLTTMRSLLPSLKLGIYTGYSYWKTYGSTDPRWAEYPLWIAWPVSPYQEPAPLKPWLTYHYHQWTFAGDGNYYGVKSSGLDLNYRNPAIVDDGGEGEEPVSGKYKCTVIWPVGASIRPAPSTANLVAGVYGLGSVFYADQLVPDQDNPAATDRQWARITDDPVNGTKFAGRYVAVKYGTPRCDVVDQSVPPTPTDEIVLKSWSITVVVNGVEKEFHG